MVTMVLGKAGIEDWFLTGILESGVGGELV